jgi:hypothetical protein
MPQQAHASSPAAGRITVTLRGYFSQDLASGVRSVTLPLAEAGTPRAAIARLRVPAGAVGLLLINKEQAGMDTPLRDGDVLDVLPLLGGGAQR